MSRRQDARHFVEGLDARQVSRAIEEVQRVVQGRVFEAMAVGEDLDDELLAGKLMRAWLREQVG
jgi:hypothetical protein